MQRINLWKVLNGYTERAGRAIQKELRGRYVRIRGPGQLVRRGGYGEELLMVVPENLPNSISRIRLLEKPSLSKVLRGCAFCIEGDLWQPGVARGKPPFFG